MGKSLIMAVTYLECLTVESASRTVHIMLNSSVERDESFENTSDDKELDVVIRDRDWKLCIKNISIFRRR